MTGAQNDTPREKSKLDVAAPDYKADGLYRARLSTFVMRGASW
jgi:hypothetical protein